MSKMQNLNLGAFIINRLGHPAGRAVAKGIWKSAWVRRMVAEHPELARIFSEGLVALTSLLELGGDHPVVRFANFVSETVATENLELLEQFEKNPDDPELAKKLDEKIASAVDKAEKDIVIAFHHVHKNEKCVPVATLIAATTTTRSGKDGKSFTTASPITLVTTDMASAMAAGTPLCGLCYPALSFRKAEESQKAKEIVPGRNFLEYVMRLKSEDVEEYKCFWGEYLVRLDGPDGPDLARKFGEAFNGKHSYEAFRFVVSLPSRNSKTKLEEWHVALDALLGRVTPPESLRKSVAGFIADEKRQTEEMFLKLFAWIERSTAKRATDIESRKARIAKLDEDWISARKAKKTGKTAKRIVVVSLLVILASWYALQRAESADTGSVTTEQKETPNVR